MALFHVTGIQPSRIELLKIQVMGFAIRAAQLASIKLGMLSGPMALRILVFNRRFPRPLH